MIVGGDGVAEFGHYRLEQPLGAGGMGQVYRAYDTTTYRVVVLRVFPDRPLRNRGHLATVRPEHRGVSRSYPVILAVVVKRKRTARQ